MTKTSKTLTILTAGIFSLGASAAMAQPENPGIPPYEMHLSNMEYDYHHSDRMSFGSESRGHVFMAENNRNDESTNPNPSRFDAHKHSSKAHSKPMINSDR